MPRTGSEVKLGMEWWVRAFGMGVPAVRRTRTTTLAPPYDSWVTPRGRYPRSPNLADID